MGQFHNVSLKIRQTPRNLGFSIFKIRQRFRSAFCPWAEFLGHRKTFDANAKLHISVVMKSWISEYYEKFNEKNIVSM